jgi:hypothetical protein
METAQEGEAGQELSQAEPVARSRSLSDGVRASLEAVRNAQVAARARARRETRWARLIAVGAITAVGFTALAAARRPPKARGVSTSPGIAAQAPADVAAPSPGIQPPHELPSADAPAPVAAVAPAERSPAPLPDELDGPVARCDSAYERRNWLAIASTCASAFGARPQDSALAMRVAQAQHRRGHIADAADWARKALAVDAEIPEAFVIVAHAETRAGHAQAAGDAYRRYLALAPRGWHAAEARRALLN